MPYSPVDGWVDMALKRVLLPCAAACGIGAIVSLIGPWVRIGAASYSTIDLIGAAGALDLISGAVRIAVVFVWFIAPLLGAATLLLLAARRPRLAAIASAVIGLLILVPAVLLLTTFSGGIAWGVFVGGGLGAVGSMSAATYLVMPDSTKTSEDAKTSENAKTR